MDPVLRQDQGEVAALDREWRRHAGGEIDPATVQVDERLTSQQLDQLNSRRDGASSAVRSTRRSDSQILGPDAEHDFAAGSSGERPGCGLLQTQLEMALAGAECGGIPPA